MSFKIQRAAATDAVVGNRTALSPLPCRSIRALIRQHSVWVGGLFHSAALRPRPQVDLQLRLRAVRGPRRSARHRRTAVREARALGASGPLGRATAHTRWAYDLANDVVPIDVAEGHHTSQLLAVVRRHLAHHRVARNHQPVHFEAPAARVGRVSSLDDSEIAGADNPLPEQGQSMMRSGAR